MTFLPESPSRSLCEPLRWKGTIGTPWGMTWTVGPGYAVDPLKKFCCDAGHHDDPLAVGGQVLDQSPRQWLGLGQKCVECGDDRFAAVAHEVQHPPAPFVRIEAELVLQADHVARAFVDHFRGEMVGVPLVVVDDVGHAGSS